MKKITGLLICALSIGFTDFPPPRADHRIEVQNATLFYEAMGKGDPIVVLHGGPGLSYEYLMPQMEELAKNHFVIFYDQRGSGKSESGELSDITLETFVEDLDRLRKHFGFQKVSLLGHSWGGFLAMQYAIAHPESVDKLILVNSAPATSEDFSLFMKEWSCRMEPFIPDLQKIQASPEFAEADPAKIEEYLTLIFQTYFAKKEKLDSLNLKMTPQAGKLWLQTSAILEKELFSKPFDLTSQLKQLSCKTLVVHGDQDPIPAATAKRLSEIIPNAEFVSLEDCGHFAYIEQKEKFFAHLEKFLQETTHGK